MSLSTKKIWGLILATLAVLNLIAFTYTNNTSQDSNPPVTSKNTHRIDKNKIEAPSVSNIVAQKRQERSKSFPSPKQKPTASENDSLTTEKRIQQQGLINIQTAIPDIKVDLKYASRHNFLNKVLYTDLKNCYLQKEATAMLKKAQKYLKNIQPEYSLLVYDGARPRSIQVEMWNNVKGTPEQRYVASPRSGSIHNFGAAVDLSIADEYGMELDMGTPYDFFGELAQPRYEQRFFDSGALTKEQIDNRALLRKVMKKAGFRGILSEWWHFNAFSKEVTRKKYKIIE